MAKPVATIESSATPDPIDSRIAIIFCIPRISGRTSAHIRLSAANVNPRTTIPFVHTPSVGKSQRVRPEFAAFLGPFAERRALGRARQPQQGDGDAPNPSG